MTGLVTTTSATGSTARATRTSRPTCSATATTTLSIEPRWPGASADLHARVAAVPGAIERTVFEVQAADWRTRPARPVPARRLRAQLRLLQRLGAHHMGWYPDDFIAGHPDAGIVQDAISARSFPFRR